MTGEGEHEDEIERRVRERMATFYEEEHQSQRRDEERRNAAIGYGVTFAIVGMVVGTLVFGFKDGTPGMIACVLIAAWIGAVYGRGRAE